MASEYRAYRLVDMAVHEEIFTAVDKGSGFGAEGLVGAFAGVWDLRPGM